MPLTVIIKERSSSVFETKSTENLKLQGIGTYSKK